MLVTVPEYGFPASYEDNFITLMVRDPYCLFVYWELTQEQRDLIAADLDCSWGEVPVFLRIYDLTGLSPDRDQAHVYQDLAVEALANNHYLTGIAPNHSYCVDLGVLGSDGRFLTLARSNVVHTPRSTMADGSGRVMAEMLDQQARIEAAAGKCEENVSSDGVYRSSGRGLPESATEGEE